MLDVTTGPQTVSSLTIGSGGGLNLYVGNVLSVSGTAAFAGTVNISIGALISLPDTLMTYSGLPSGTFSQINGLPSSDTLSYSSAARWKSSPPARPRWTKVPVEAGQIPPTGLPRGFPDSGTLTFPELGATSTIEVTLDGPQSAAALVFSGSEGYQLQPGNSGTLTLNTSGTPR